MSDNAETIKDNSTKPKRATSDGVTVEQHSVQEQIDADRYYESKRAAANNTGWPVRVNRIKPGGTV